MLILVAYDVNTQTAEGQKRLRRVAQVCLNYGQRVQQSVFEVQVDNTRYTAMRNRLLAIIDKDADSLRLYQVQGKREAYGGVTAIDFTAPLVI